MRPAEILQKYLSDNGYTYFHYRADTYTVYSPPDKRRLSQQLKHLCAVLHLLSQYIPDLLDVRIQNGTFKCLSES